MDMHEAVPSGKLRLVSNSSRKNTVNVLVDYFVLGGFSHPCFAVG